MNVKGIRSSVSATGEKVLSGVIKEEDLSGSGLSIRVARSATIGPNVIRDPFVHADSYIIQTIQKKLKRRRRVTSYWLSMARRA